MLGDGDGVAAAAVRHGYAKGGEAGHVEPVGAGAGHLHELQVRAATRHRHFDLPIAEDHNGVLHESGLLFCAQIRVDPGDVGIRRKCAKVLHLPVIRCEKRDLGSHAAS